MNAIADLLANPSLKRAVVGAMAAGLIALNRKLGLGLELGDVAALVTLAVAFLAQSAAKEVKMAGVEAAAKVVTTEDAAKELSK